MSTPHAVIIDDQASNIHVLAMMLDQEGVSHTAITRANEVLPALPQLEHIDIVFLDLEMPNVNNFDLLAELKGQEQLLNVPIVAYTVHTSEIDVARQAGFDGFLGKPLSVTEFPDQLRRILDGEPVWAW